MVRLAVPGELEEVLAGCRLIQLGLAGRTEARPDLL